MSSLTPQDVILSVWANEHVYRSYDSLLSYQTIFRDRNIRPDGDMLLNRCYDGGSSAY